MCWETHEALPTRSRDRNIRSRDRNITNLRPDKTPYYGLSHKHTNKPTNKKEICASLPKSKCNQTKYMGLNV